MRCPHRYRLSRLVCSRALTARGRGARRRRAASDAVAARAAAGAQTRACGAAPAAAARHVGAPPRRCSPECRLLAVCVCVYVCADASPAPTQSNRILCRLRTHPGERSGGRRACSGFVLSGGASARGSGTTKRTCAEGGGGHAAGASRVGRVTSGAPSPAPSSTYRRTKSIPFSGESECSALCRLALTQPR